MKEILKILSLLIIVVVIGINTVVSNDIMVSQNSFSIYNYAQAFVEQNQEDKWIKLRDWKNCDGLYELGTLNGNIIRKHISCTNCAWDCDAKKVPFDYPLPDECNSAYTCQQNAEDNYTL